ncbi:MAG: anaerobic ribonucleoside-triphosphate reductase activating protein [Candidatus Hermodarchaeota archaeon]
MKVGGIVDISTVDIPHRSAMVIFTVGCNFKCAFCHNKYLLQLNVGREYDIEELVDKIKINELISGVSISGGEPTLQKDLPELCKEIQKVGKYLSIDTNGSNPGVVKLISPNINRVALDLKSPLNLEKLRKITGVKVDIDKIVETIEFVNNQKELDFEIRTTYVGALITQNDVEDIINFLKNKEFRGNFVLQQYQFFEGVGEKFKQIFSKPEHEDLLNILKPYKDIELPFEIFLRDEYVGYCNLDKLLL